MWYVCSTCGRVLKCSLSAHLVQVKLLLFTLYLNGGLQALSVGKPSEWMSKFWMVWFLKTESEPNFGFPHIPIGSKWRQQANNKVTDRPVTSLVACCLHSIMCQKQDNFGKL